MDVHVILVSDMSAFNPYIGGRKDMFSEDILPEASRVLNSGGEITISATKGNPYVKPDNFPSIEQLNSMGFEVIEYDVPLTSLSNYSSKYSHMKFFTTGAVSSIHPEDMRTFVLRKI